MEKWPSSVNTSQNRGLKRIIMPHMEVLLMVGILVSILKMSLHSTVDPHSSEKYGTNAGEIFGLVR